MKSLMFSIILPAYNGADSIDQTLKSILSQSFTDYEIIINDDNSKDNTADVVNSFLDKRISLYKNSVNLGYPGNLRQCLKKASGDIIYLMGQDDVLGKDALLNTCNAFLSSHDIGAVTRPYYWFDTDISRPVRVKKQLNLYCDEVVRITDSYARIVAVFNTLDQLSGLAFRRVYIDTDFHDDIFPCHVYPFASIFKKHPIVFLKDYNVAVRIRTSQCRSLSSIYDKSPVQSWVDLFDNVFGEKEFKKLRSYCVKNFVANNYVGLVQIRNYSRFANLLREIFLLVKYRPLNLLNFLFWFFSIGTIIVPPSFLIPLVDWYKNKISSRWLTNIKFDYQL